MTRDETAEHDVHRPEQRHQAEHQIGLIEKPTGRRGLAQGRIGDGHGALGKRVRQVVPIFRTVTTANPGLLHCTMRATRELALACIALPLRAKQQSRQAPSSEGQVGLPRSPLNQE